MAAFSCRLTGKVKRSWLGKWFWHPELGSTSCHFCRFAMSFRNYEFKAYGVMSND